MSRVSIRGRAGTFLAIGLAVFAFAMSYDLGTIRSHAQTLRSLEAQQEQAHHDLATQVQRREDCRRLARLLGVQDLDELLETAGQDPVAYLNGLLREAGVQILDLAVTGQKRFTQLKRTELLVRAAGDYPALVDFVRRLEEGRRLARIEDFEIATTMDSRNLEGRFQLALYDPLPAPEGS